jgi:hypothetical protein
LQRPFAAISYFRLLGLILMATTEVANVQSRRRECGSRRADVLLGEQFSPRVIEIDQPRKMRASPKTRVERAAG